MEHAVAPRSLKPPDGFSLIELLIAVAVLSVLAVGASLSVGRNGTLQEADQTLFQRNFKAVRQLSVTGQQSRGLMVDPDGLRLAQHGPEGWTISEQHQSWRGRVSLTVTGRARTGTVTGSRSGEAPTLIFLSNGESTPFEILFRNEGQHLRCRSDGWTELTCDG